MSKSPSPIGLVIEWSPRKIVSFDVATGEKRSYTDATQLPFAGREALLAISRRSVFVRAARVPNAAPEDVRMVVQMKLAELFPVPPSDLAYDFLMMSDLNADGRLALIIAMPVIELRRAYEQLSAANIKIRRVVPVAIGSTFIAESLSIKDAAVVEKTDELASVDLIVDGLLRHSRVVPPGAPLEVEISRTFNVAGLPCSHIIAAGGAEVGDADINTKSTALEALAGAWLDRLRLNLQLPEVVAAQELKARRKRQVGAGLMFALAVGLAGFTFYDRAQSQKVVDAKTADNARQLVKYQSAQKTAEANLAKQLKIDQTLLQAFQPAQSLGDITVDVANTAPPGIWLSGISLERGKVITVRGTATNNSAIAAYVSKLNSDPRLRNVKLMFSSDAVVEKVPVKQFSLSAFPNGNLPIALQQKAGVKGGSQ